MSIEDRLQDAPAQITTDQRCQIEALACQKPEKHGRPITNWTAREIADELKKRKIVTNISARHDEMTGVQSVGTQTSRLAYLAG